MIYNINIKNDKKLNSSLTLTIAFFLFSLVEVFAEFKIDTNLQWITKPFLIPLLMTLYLLNSTKKSSLYLLALGFNWLANILFISVKIEYLMIASICLLIHRLLIIIKIFKDERSLGLFPIFLGSVPFLFLFLSLVNMVYDTIKEKEFLLILCQIILMSLFGGFSLANFSMKNTFPSKFLLISSLFFGINVFILGVKFYYIDFTFLKPLSMIFFILGHYVFYYFMILNENK